MRGGGTTGEGDGGGKILGCLGNPLSRGLRFLCCFVDVCLWEDNIDQKLLSNLICVCVCVRVCGLDPGS